MKTNLLSPLLIAVIVALSVYVSYLHDEESARSERYHETVNFRSDEINPCYDLDDLRYIEGLPLSGKVHVDSIVNGKMYIK